MKSPRTAASQVTTGIGSIGLSVGGLTVQLARGGSTLSALAMYATAAVLAIATAVVAIVRIRTNRPAESRRMSALTRLARKHPDADRAMRLLMADPLIAGNDFLTSQAAASLPGHGDAPARSPAGRAPNRPGLAEAARDRPGLAEAARDRPGLAEAARDQPA